MLIHSRITSSVSHQCFSLIQIKLFIDPNSAVKDYIGHLAELELDVMLSSS